VVYAGPFFRGCKQLYRAGPPQFGAQNIFSFKIEIYFSHPAVFTRTLQKFHKYTWSGLRFPNKIVSVSGNNNPDAYDMKFCVFLWGQGSLLPVIRPPHKLQCNCRGRISGQQWPCDVVFLHQTKVSIYIVSLGTSAISRTAQHQLSS
jgi:hypothetical protein